MARRRAETGTAGLLLAALLPAVALVGGCGSDGPPADAADPPARILLISVDTMSATHLGAWGGDDANSAVLDSLAAAGTLFRRCLVPQVWTLSSHMSMFTALAPGVHRVGMGTSLAPGLPTLPERLAEAGYGTCGVFTSNYWLDAGFGFGRGFASYSHVALDRDAGARALAWLRRNPPPAPVEPTWFAFVHYMDPHTLPTDHRYPYRPRDASWWRYAGAEARAVGKHVMPLPPSDPFHDRGVRRWDLAAYEREFLRGSYDDCIRYWDGVRLRRVLDELRRDGLLAGTLIVVTADHGEEFGEHGRFGHKSPHREVREVPLVFVWPGRIAAGGVVDEPVSVMDIAPTLLDLAGLAPLPRAQGVSLRPCLEDTAAVPPRRAFLVDGDHRGYRQEPTGFVAREDGAWWMLKARCDTAGTGGTFRPARVDSILALYDLDRDPDEREDLSARRPAVADALAARLQERLVTEAALAARLLGVGDDAPEFELDDAQKRQLKALGY